MHLLHRPATSRHVLHACIRNAPSLSPFPKAHRLGLRLPDVVLGRGIGFTASQPVGPSPNNVLKAPGWGLPLADNVLGTVTELYADAGSHVFADETIAVIETDKLAVDVKATQTGMISERLVSVGEDVKIFQPMYAIDVDSEPPPAGSEAWQKARTWTGLHAQRVDEERAEAERLWREHQERQKAASGGGSSEWRWQSTAREFRHEQQDGPQDFRHRQYRHHHPRGHQWRQPRSPSWSASNASGRRQQPQPSADVLAMPLKELVPHVLRYHASDPLLCLGLRPGASSAAIRKRYLALAMKMHPDRAKEAHPQLNEAFGHMGSAFNTLRGRR
jgi:pyruvate/2-oxoglutarate dehydrogenase complex dihydrolipoamide acyltransferase (E2) component